MKQARSLDGDPSGAFAQTTLAKLEAALNRERLKLGRSEDLRDLVMKELDALTIMLMAESILAPIALLALGDLLLMVLYAGALSLAAFVILFLSLGRLNQAEGRLRLRIRSVEDEMMALRRSRAGGRK